MRGASIPRIIYLVYEDTGLPMDTDDLDEITFEVYHYTTRRLLGTYTLGGSTVTVIDHEDGEVRFIVPQSVSGAAKRGNYYVIATTEETDLEYEDNNHIRKGIGFCFQLI